MKTNDEVPQGNGNVQNMPGTSSSPKTAAENPGVTYALAYLMLPAI